MSKIGVIGDKSSVLGFKAFGLDVFACETAAEAIPTLHSMVEEEYGIIYITERLYKDMRDVTSQYDDMRTPAIIPIPGMDGSYGIGVANVKKSVERAVGADILFGGDK